MDLYAFEGLRYAKRASAPRQAPGQAPERNGALGAEEAGRRVAPPYDQINDAARDRLQAQSPLQFAHLTRPLASPGDDPYRHAADLHAGWLAAGDVERDDRPALYPYVIDLAGGGRRLGVMALIGYADPSVIRPHEQTLDKPLADRTALLAATGVDLEPALLLADDDGKLDELVAEDVRGRPPLVDHLDAEGNHHRLYRVDDPGRIRLYQQAVAAHPAAIADGHHRYKAGQRYARDHGAQAGEAAAAKLAVVTSMSSPAVVIDPIHRALRTAADRERLAGLARARRPFQPAAGAPHASPGAQLAAAVAGEPQPALGVWVHGSEPEIWQLAPSGPSSPLAPGAGDATAPAPEIPQPRTAPAGEKPPPPPHLVVEIFQRWLLPALGLPAEAATDGTLVYRSNPAELYAQIESGELGTGFWLPPMRPADFAAAIADGNLLPPKSTRFLPKVMSGLVWADQRSRLL